MDFEVLWLVFVKIITHIINTSLQTSAMLERFNLAILNPHLKKMQLEIINENFRPVSYLPYASKLIERAVTNQFFQRIMDNVLLEPMNQHIKRDMAQNQYC